MTIHTLHVECVMLLLIYTILTVANSWLYKGTKGIHWFSLYNFFSFLSAAAVALRGHIPDFVSIVAGNLFFVIAYFLLYISLATLFGSRRRNFWFQATLVAAAVFAMVQWGYIDPNTTIRLIAYSAILFLQEAHIVLFLFRRRRSLSHHVGGPLALMLALLALTNVIRIAGVTLTGAPSNYLQAGAFLAWIVMINSCLQCGVIVAYVWMTAALLRNDLQVQASTDPLTGLLNRRAMEEAADRKITVCNAAKTPLSAIVIDLDRFKAINDTFGHSRGDQTLIAVASSLSAGIRKGDLLGRMGGDEFAIVLPDASLDQATQLAERLRTSLEALQIGDERPIQITASFGLAQAGPHARDWDTLTIACDKALYASKNRGGNHTSITAPDMQHSALVC